MPGGTIRGPFARIMIKKLIPFPITKKLITQITLGILVCVLVFFFVVTHFDISWDLEGIYVLHDDKGLLYDIADEIHLGQEGRLIFRIDFGDIKEFLVDEWRLLSRPEHDPQEVDLHVEWKERHGDGYVEAHYPGGKRLLTCFGRFLDDDGKAPEGLFVGGGIPYTKHDHINVTMNETGMAYFNGAEWQHLWCNVNEGIAPVFLQEHPTYPPSKWTYLGSKVLLERKDSVVIRSSHEINEPGMHLHMDRFVFFKAGDTFFILVIRIRNIGLQTTGYFYIYGDEPWVGDYGSSVGNVGWGKDRLFQYEGRVDANKYSFVGMFDYGNTAVPGEDGIFTGAANFIEWLGDNKPELVYFSNSIGGYAEESAKVPLSHKTNRVLFLQWQRTLQPNEETMHILGIGMADKDPETGFPVKPRVALSEEDWKYLKQDR